MSAGKLPKLFRDALDALDAAEAVDSGKHPLIHRRRLLALRAARAALHQEHPHLEYWLFPYTGFQEARRDELLRLIAETQKEASNV